MHTPPWSPTRWDAAYLRGAHLSATIQYRPFLHADIYDYIRMGYWTVLPYDSVRHMSHLRLAPTGVVPQTEQRPHLSWTIPFITRIRNAFRYFLCKQCNLAGHYRDFFKTLVMPIHNMVPHCSLKYTLQMAIITCHSCHKLH